MAWEVRLETEGMRHSGRCREAVMRWRGVGGGQTWAMNHHMDYYKRIYMTSSVVLCHLLDHLVTASL